MPRVCRIDHPSGPLAALPSRFLGLSPRRPAAAAYYGSVFLRPHPAWAYVEGTQKKDFGGPFFEHTHMWVAMRLASPRSVSSNFTNSDHAGWSMPSSSHMVENLERSCSQAPALCAQGLFSKMVQIPEYEFSTHMLINVHKAWVSVHDIPSKEILLPPTQHAHITARAIQASQMRLLRVLQ